MDAEKARLHVIGELNKAREEFQAKLKPMSEADFARRSLDPGWTNGQVMFHITLGYMLLPVLIPVMILFAHLPKAISNAFVWLLNASTPIFNWINGLGPRGGARVYDRSRLAGKFDRTLDAVERTARRLKPHQWKLSMPMPNRWDPGFGTERTVEGVFHYMIGHMHFHFGQLAK